MFENARWIYVIVETASVDKIALIKFLRVLSCAVDGTPCSLKQGKEWAEQMQREQDGIGLFYMPAQLFKMAQYLAIKLDIGFTEANASVEAAIEQNLAQV
jgi:hypothetical protein